VRIALRSPDTLPDQHRPRRIAWEDDAFESAYSSG
jgi:hypothetical protein